MKRDDMILLGGAAVVGLVALYILTRPTTASATGLPTGPAEVPASQYQSQEAEIIGAVGGALGSLFGGIGSIVSAASNSGGTIPTRTSQLAAQASS